MEQIYFLEENYEEWIEFSHLIDFGTEGSIMSFGDEVIKLLHQNLNSITKYRLRKLESIDGLKEFITMPTKEIYYDYRFIGFAMEYAGINFRDVLIKHINDGTLTDDIKITYLKHIRDLLIYFEKEHGTDKTKKGDYLIKRKYIESRIKL